MCDIGTFFNGQTGGAKKRPSKTTPTPTPTPTTPTPTPTLQIPLPEFVVKDGVKFFRNKPNIPLPANYEWDKIPGLGWTASIRPNSPISALWDLVVDTRGAFIDTVIKPIPGLGWVITEIDKKILASDRFREGRSETKYGKPTTKEILGYIFDPETQKPRAVKVDKPPPLPPTDELPTEPQLPEPPTEPPPLPPTEPPPLPPMDEQNGGRKRKHKRKLRPPRIFKDEDGYYIWIKRKKIYVTDSKGKRSLNAKLIRRRVITKYGVKDREPNQPVRRGAFTVPRKRDNVAEKKRENEITQLSQQIEELRKKIAQSEQQTMPMMATNEAKKSLTRQQLFTLYNAQEEQNKDREQMRKLALEKMKLLEKQRQEDREQAMRDRDRAELLEKIKEDRARQRQREQDERLMRMFREERKQPMINMIQAEQPRTIPNENKREQLLIEYKQDDELDKYADSSNDTEYYNQLDEKVNEMLESQPDPRDDIDDYSLYSLPSELLQTLPDSEFSEEKKLTPPPQPPHRPQRPPQPPHRPDNIQDDEIKLPPQPKRVDNVQDALDTEIKHGDEIELPPLPETIEQKERNIQENFKFLRSIGVTAPKILNAIMDSPKMDEGSKIFAKNLLNDRMGPSKKLDVLFNYFHSSDILNEKLTNARNKSKFDPKYFSKGSAMAKQERVKIINAIFDIKTGKGIDEMEEDGLYDSQINKIMARYPDYKGTFSRDELDLLGNDKFQAFVMNTDVSSGRGKHWVGCVINATAEGPDQYSIMYYDSFGDEPPSNFSKDISNVINKIKPERYLKYKVNNIVHQEASADTCGIHATEFLKKILNGRSFKDATGFNKLYGLDQSEDREKLADKKMRALKGNGKFPYI